MSSLLAWALFCATATCNAEPASIDPATCSPSNVLAGVFEPSSVFLEFVLAGDQLVDEHDLLWRRRFRFAFAGVGDVRASGSCRSQPCCRLLRFAAFADFAQRTCSSRRRRRPFRHPPANSCAGDGEDVQAAQEFKGSRFPLWFTGDLRAERVDERGLRRRARAKQRAGREQEHRQHRRRARERVDGAGTGRMPRRCARACSVTCNSA